MPQRILQTVKKVGYQTGLGLLLLASSAYAGDILVQVEQWQEGAPLFLALAPGESQRWPQLPLQQRLSHDGQARFSELPAGRYAIQLFQDLNGNGQLDHSPRGIPLEPVGFSGNPPLLNGKPKPEQASFVHGEGDTRLTIRLQSPKAKR
ncbi:DUF2141 domain-containing protein [Pseudomonas xionganensis]|uniref:DUF2141 domain-containing protein n=1 Tax=Pseudomonas xionganensis TaxID=2654845 RepID=A0A6I4KXN4_9PSED|nr:DUF2141 domain-containing protein [Pseudomonas xionganensis]MVW74533.1 DUF2141 domain-containing protein [Pseudomonas xionganensis]